MPSKTLVRQRKSLVADMLMICFCIVFPHAARLPMFVYPIVVLLLLWGFLKLTGRTFADIGFRWRDLSWRSFLVGGFAGALYATILFLAIGPFISWATGWSPADLHDFYYIRNDLNGFLTLLAIACLWVIPYEEIIFRGFIFSTIQSHVYPGRFWPSAAITSVLFAFYHWQEGSLAVLSIFITSIVMFVVYKYARMNLWYVIFFHALYDVVMLSLIRTGYM